MKQIRVVHVIEQEKEAHYFNNLIDYTPRHEVEFVVVTFSPEGPFTESIRSRDIRAYSLDAAGKSKSLKAAAALKKVLVREDPDIVHTHLFFPTLIGSTLAKLQGRRVVNTRHHSDALHLLPNP